MSSYGRKFDRKNNIPRGERVYIALQEGKCVDCGTGLNFEDVADGTYFKCPSCQWEGEFQKGRSDSGVFKSPFN